MPPTKGDVLRNMDTIWSNIALPVEGVVMRDRQTEVDRQTDRSRQTHTQGEGEREKERYKVREGTKQNQMFTEVTRIRMLQ